MSYAKFKQYGKKFSEHYWGDYVHNIWLRYFEKHGKDLFQEDKPNNWIYRAIKWEFLKSLNWDEKQQGDVSTVSWQDMIVDVESNEASMNDILIYNELDHFIKLKIKRFIKSNVDADVQYNKYIKIYELMKFGYGTQDIANDIGVSEAQISYYKKQIREAVNYMAYVNPFVGSKVKVKKTVTESQWEKRKDHDDFELEDYNEYYHLYVHKESGEGWLMRLPDEKQIHK